MDADSISKKGFFKASAVSTVRAMVLCATGALIGLGIAGYGLFTVGSDVSLEAGLLDLLDGYELIDVVVVDDQDPLAAMEHAARTRPRPARAAQVAADEGAHDAVIELG